MIAVIVSFESEQLVHVDRAAAVAAAS